MTKRTAESYLVIRTMGLELKRKKLTDLSITEMWAGLTLSRAEREKYGGFVRAAVLKAHFSKFHQRHNQDTVLLEKTEQPALYSDPIIKNCFKN